MAGNSTTSTSASLDDDDFGHISTVGMPRTRQLPRWALRGDEVCARPLMASWIQGVGGRQKEGMEVLSPQATEYYSASCILSATACRIPQATQAPKHPAPTVSVQEGPTDVLGISCWVWPIVTPGAKRTAKLRSRGWFRLQLDDITSVLRLAAGTMLQGHVSRLTRKHMGVHGYFCPILTSCQAVYYH